MGGSWRFSHLWPIVVSLGFLSKSFSFLSLNPYFHLCQVWPSHSSIPASSELRRAQVDSRAVGCGQSWDYKPCHPSRRRKSPLTQNPAEAALPGQGCRLFTSNAGKSDFLTFSPLMSHRKPFQPASHSIPKLPSTRRPEFYFLAPNILTF